MRLDQLISSTLPAFPQSTSPFIIAEAGVNHEGSIDLAKRLIDDAKEGGANAIKFQTYRAGTLASRNSPAYWNLVCEPTQSQYELFRKHDKFWKNECCILKDHCDKVGIEFLSTPFDVESAKFLNDLMTTFKISSSDITNRPFIEYICDFGKPILLSVGAAYLYEIFEAVEWIDAGGNDLALLHCVLNYPTDNQNANLGAIKDLRKRFPERHIGYSDHTLPQDMLPCTTAWLLGAEIIEKHFTHDKKLPGNDHYHAMDKSDLVVLRTLIERNKELMGEFKVTAHSEEDTARKNARRSLVTSRDLPAGHVIIMDDITWKRPANGISPKMYKQVLGCQTKVAIKNDTAIQWNHLL
jgi:N-acetylneuraminate synthase